MEQYLHSSQNNNLLSSKGQTPPQPAPLEVSLMALTPQLHQARSCGPALLPLPYALGMLLWY